jgi:hypothetical protein
MSKLPYLCNHDDDDDDDDDEQKILNSKRLAISKIWETSSPLTSKGIVAFLPFTLPMTLCPVLHFTHQMLLKHHLQDFIFMGNLTSIFSITN